MSIFKKTIVALMGLAMTHAAWSFSILGPGDAQGNPAKAWQNRGPNAGWLIGYGFTIPGDIGGPMDLIEAYRWNTPVITYAFDESFVRFFGENGMRAVDQAFKILNDLPTASRMSEELDEFPLTTLRQNYEATALSLIDLKSTALSLILEELGLAQAERWVWSIRNRDPIAGTPFAVYDVIRYNYDPVTLRLSPYVNGTLYTYRIIEVPAGAVDAPYAEAQEELVLAGVPPNLSVTSFTPPGFFRTGLTRDDVGGLRFLLHPRNRVVETLLPGIIPGIQGWLPFLGTNFLGTNIAGNTNIVGTNNFASVGIRGGINKLTFRRVAFDSLIGGTFTPVTNAFIDHVITTNNAVASQRVMRPITRPDFVFAVEDLLGNIAFRTDTTGWINNDPLTPEAQIGGPGVISPPITITFNMIFPIFLNQSPSFVTEPQPGDLLGSRGFTWASYDGTTNAPVIYPEYFHYTLNDLRNAARNAGQ